MHGVETQVNKTANAISGEIIAKDYGKYARNKSILAIIYDIFAVLFAGGGFFILYMVLDTLSTTEITTSFIKLATTLGLFTISGYIFRRGTIQHKESIVAKRTDLTIRQYKPFVSVLNDDEQEKIVSEIAKRIFVVGDINIDAPSKSSLNFFKSRGETRD